MIETLTDKEKYVMRELVLGKQNKEISESLGISTHDVDYRLRRVFSKLNVDNRVSAAILFFGETFLSTVKRVGG